jgi:hypothetical protein
MRQGTAVRRPLVGCLHTCARACAHIHMRTHARTVRRPPVSRPCTSTLSARARKDTLCARAFPCAGTACVLRSGVLLQGARSDAGSTARSAARSATRSDARRAGSRCVLFGKPLLESGTMGTKCNVHHPHRGTSPSTTMAVRTRTPRCARLPALLLLCCCFAAAAAAAAAAAVL